MPKPANASASTDTWNPDSAPTAVHDPAPASAEGVNYGGASERPHSLEMDVQRALLNLPGVEFSSLNIHRLSDGVCLTGVVKVAARDSEKLERAARVKGVDRVLNYLTFQEPTRTAMRK